MRKYQKSCSKLIWPFYSLLQLFEQKCHRSHISASSVHKYQKLSPRVRCTTCLREFGAQVSQISPQVLWTSITNRVFSWFDHFTAYNNCMSKNVTELISPRVLWTSIRILVPSSFDLFKAYYNCISKNVTRLINPRVLCKSFTNRYLNWFSVSRLITAVWTKMSQNSYLREFCAQVSQLVFLADLTVLRLITTV